MKDNLYFADVCVCCGCILPEGEIICNECKKVNVAGNSCVTDEKSIFIMVNHSRRNRVSA